MRKIVIAGNSFPEVCGLQALLEENTKGIRYIHDRAAAAGGLLILALSDELLPGWGRYLPLIRQVVRQRGWPGEVAVLVPDQLRHIALPGLWEHILPGRLSCEELAGRLKFPNPGRRRLKSGVGRLRREHSQVLKELYRKVRRNCRGREEDRLSAYRYRIRNEGVKRSGFPTLQVFCAVSAGRCLSRPADGGHDVMLFVRRGMRFVSEVEIMPEL
ncbi:hypothetical protein EWJ82_19940 [Salmonella enterica subsp. enterica serovar Weybridge]|uniref:Uncharacterized protein n=1 Tax=Salmonella typhimurium (strain SL1344) TaxID=216597 RepID=A0A718Y4G5_SALTS|nr:hypothetical protein [Salmonella enterica subsp. enterica serovar Weybridge]HAD6864517.1 hypothetical protein [Salmonella enterica subsp. enterica serovar Typhimurium str. SL1344]